MTQVEVMKLALEFIDANADGADERDIALALRQAIEQAQKQEPVAWMHPEWRNYTRAPSPSVTPKEGWIPLYTSPPQRQPLTFEEVEDCFPDGYSTEDNGILVSAQWLHDYARAIEAAHGIKGEA